MNDQLRQTNKKSNVYRIHSNRLLQRSVTGVVVKIGGGAIYYKTRYQDCLEHSSAEASASAEFIATADASKQLSYIKYILDHNELSRIQATKLHEDS